MQVPGRSLFSMIFENTILLCVFDRCAFYSMYAAFYFSVGKCFFFLHNGQKAWNLYLIAFRLIARFTSGSQLNCTKKMHLNRFLNYRVQLCLIWL